MKTVLQFTHGLMNFVNSLAALKVIGKAGRVRAESGEEHMSGPRVWATPIL